MKKDLRKILMCLGLFFQTDLVAARKRHRGKASMQNHNGNNKSNEIIDSGIDEDTENYGVNGCESATTGTANCAVKGLENSELGTDVDAIPVLDSATSGTAGNAVGGFVLDSVFSQDHGVPIEHDKNSNASTDFDTVSITEVPISSIPFSSLVANENAKKIYKESDRDELLNKFGGAKGQIKITAKKFSEYAQCSHEAGAVKNMRSSTEWEVYVKATRKMIDRFQNLLDFDAQYPNKLNFSVKKVALELEKELSLLDTKLKKIKDKSPKMLNVLTEFERYKPTNEAKENKDLTVKALKNNNTVEKKTEPVKSMTVKELPKKIEERVVLAKKSVKPEIIAPLSDINKNQSNVKFKGSTLDLDVDSVNHDEYLNASQVSVSSFFDYLNIAGYVTYGIALEDYNTTFSGYLSPQLHGFAGGIGILTNFWLVNNELENSEEVTSSFVNNLKLLLLVGCHHSGYKNLESSNLDLDFKAGLVYSLSNLSENSYFASYNAGIVGGITGGCYEGGLILYTPKGISMFIGYHHKK